ncbi:MAG TPA: hypothetical protein VHP55_11950 [Usitatibacter sp.]|jgi:hypothetical protein|nr:hypothetical protein [Usitatibacter sp.]
MNERDKYILDLATNLFDAFLKHGYAHPVAIDQALDLAEKFVCRHEDRLKARAEAEKAAPPAQQ